MSQSPEEMGAPAENMRSYRRGWKAFARMISEGRSFSGQERNCCFLNLGNGEFADVSAATELDFSDDARAISVVDWDFDGRLDFWVTNRTAPRIRFLRNETQNDGKFVALKLQGVRCNRDAIGATVQLYISDTKNKTSQVLLRQVSAGDGYLSQSSKWVQFGVPTNMAVDRVLVRWPGGAEETFRGIESGCHYKLLEHGNATRWNPPTLPQETNPPHSLLPRKVENFHRTVLVGKVPLPHASFRNFQGDHVSLASFVGKPLLVNLWSPTCIPCLQELAEWAQNSERLAESNLRILALTVDELIDPTQPVAIPAKESLASIGFRGIAGVAQPELMQIFETMHHTYLSRRQALPIPSSFLLDSAGQLAVIYKGPIPVKTLIEDIELLDSNAERRRMSAVPFPGRWNVKPFSPDPERIAKQLERLGRTDAAVLYAQRCIQQIDAQRNTRTSESASARFFSERRKTLIDLYGTLGELQLKLGQPKNAEKSFSRLLELGNNGTKLHRDIGESFLANNMPAQAVKHLAVAASAAPDDGALFYQLGIAELATRKPREAIEHLRRAHELLPTDANTCFHLANALHGTGRTTEAIGFYRRSLQLHPDWAFALNNLAWILATHHDELIRDGEEAVRLAETLCEKNQYSDPSALATLAAAYAQQQRFADASHWNSRARELAESRGQNSLADRLRERGKRLENQLPVRE